MGRPATKFEEHFAMALGRSMEREGKLQERIASLRARVAELAAINENLMIYKRDHWVLMRDLAESRARERRLREAIASEVADIARRIGPARMPESVCTELEQLASKYRRWNADDAPPAGGSIMEGMDALREAGGKAWDAVADPAAYLAGDDAPPAGTTEHD